MYIGTFDSFRFTAEADTACNAIVTAGGFNGVTKANVPAGEVGLAFIGIPAVVFSFPVEALAEAKNQGVAVYIDGDGDLTFSANDGAAQNPTAYAQFGLLWEGAASGATEIKVALR